MDYKISYKDFSEICRFCLIYGELKPLFELEVLNIFTKLVDIEIKENDELPQHICENCTKQFEDFSSFINKCIINQSTLKTIFLEYSFKTEEKLNALDYQWPDGYNEDIDSTEDDKKEIEDEDYIPEEETQKYSESEEKKNKKTVAKKIKGRKKTTKVKKDVVKKSNVQLICENCNQQFLGKTKLNAHYKENPSCMPKDYKCSDCNKAFNKKYKLTAHMRSHTKEEPFECSICSKRFRFSQNLRRHKLIHNGVKPFKCEVCGKEFSRAHVRNEHMNIHTGHNPYICNYCGKGFKRYANHFIHVYRHKLINGEVEKKSDRKLYLQLECDICHKIFASRGGLANHLTLHKAEPRERAFLCNDCGKGFVTYAQLESHSRIHSGVKPFECKDCGRRFRQRSAINTHQLLHTGRKPHKCEICQKFFTQSGHLKVHMRTHSGEKPYNCNFCGKPFALKSNLKVHVRIHTGETPYVCKVCGMGFYDSSTLKKHLKGHSNGIAPPAEDNNASVEDETL